MTTQSKRMCQSSGDVISNLQRDAIDNILLRLPLCDAVKTSVLSRRWRYMWASLPSLVFDRDAFKFGTTETTHDRLLTTIYEVLLLYRGVMVTFVLSLPGLKSCPQIDKLVSFVSSKNFGLKKFTLHILEGHEPYKLPSSLFSLVELTYLNLQHCVIKPPIGFKGFNRLVYMEISKCSILPDVLSDLISSCPILDVLKVKIPMLIEGHIEISAPNLRMLFLTGQFPSICFKYTPRLHRCLLSGHPGFVPLERTHSNAFQSLHNLPAIAHLGLSYYYAGGKSDGSSMPRTFNHLSTLYLKDISFCLLHEVSNVTCLIRSSPNLEKIVVYAKASAEGSNDALEDVMPLFRVQEWSDVNLNSLREVEFHNISGTGSELGFIEVLLTISPKLETMTVGPGKKVTLTGRLEILTKVTCFRRASTLAKIIFKN